MRHFDSAGLRPLGTRDAEVLVGTYPAAAYRTEIDEDGTARVWRIGAEGESGESSQSGTNDHGLRRPVTPAEINRLNREHHARYTGKKA